MAKVNKKGEFFVEDNKVEEAKKTILIVDDEKSIVDIIIYNLAKEGLITAIKPLKTIKMKENDRFSTSVDDI